MGLIFGGASLRGAYIRMEAYIWRTCIQKEIFLVSGGLIFGRGLIFKRRFVLVSRGAYIRGGLIFGILRYL